MVATETDIEIRHQHYSCHQIVHLIDSGVIGGHSSWICGRFIAGGLTGRRIIFLRVSCSDYESGS